MVRIRRDGEDLCVDGGEVGLVLAEGDQLGGANEGKIEGVEEQDSPLALGPVLGEGDL